MSTLKRLFPIWWRPALFLFVLVTIAWLPLVGMDFWQDDRALIFKLQHPFESAGLFGQTLWGNGPYRAVAAPIYPLYRVFGLHPAPYFALSIVVYALATAAIWWFARQLFERRDYAFATAALFAVSHPGADAMLRIINSYQNLFGLIGAAITLGGLVAHLRTNRLAWLGVSLLGYVFALELAFVRSAGLIIPILAGLALFSPVRAKRLALDLGMAVGRALPYLAVFNYLYEPTADPNHSLSRLVVSIVSERNYQVLGSLVATLGNLVLPAGAHPIVGGAFVIGAVGLAAATWRRGPLGRIVLFGLITSVAMFLPNWIQYPTTPFNTTHRYLTGSLLGYLPLLVVAAFYLTERFKLPKITLFRERFPVMIALIGLVFIVLNLQYLTGLITTRALPSKRFYRELRTLVPQLPKGSLLYFEVANDSKTTTQFRDFFAVGSMPDETALAIHYGIDRYDLKIAASTEELLAEAAKNETPSEKLYYFRYGPEGLSDQSKTFRQLIENGLSINLENQTIAQGQRVSFKLNELTAGLPAFLKMSYQFKSLDNEPLIDPALQAAIEFRQGLKASVSSQWRLQEATHLLDGDPETPWLAHRIHWNDYNQEEIVIDFGAPRKVDHMSWLNGHESRTATSYTIAADQGGAWKNLIEQTKNGSKKTGELIDEHFDAVTTTKLRLIISASSGGDAPQIAELYPLPNIEPPLTLTVGTPAKRLPQVVPIKPGNGTIGIALPNVTNLNPIVLGPLKPNGSLKIEGTQVQIPSLKELKSQGLLKQFSEN
ncbi:discoidin domain-containing protein [Candidatus Berkelbacteria bacterium]|nr:discoidin domain-containing protein [Candidatus Berkelbacteria bacterium]